LATRLRRISQILFFILFVGLLARTKLLGPSGSGAQPLLPVNLFFKLDPLTALVNLLAGHTLTLALLGPLLILIFAAIFGRFFCGWICPLGSLNHFLGRVRSQPAAARIHSNRSKKWQAAKYYLLIAGLMAALFRVNLLGWIDPFSWMLRSAGLSFLPAVASKKYAVVSMPHYGLNLALGAAFLALLAMNLRIPRFWCRALCPLGALLGLASRWSPVRLRKDASTCNQCARCQLDCQGGDNPIGGAEWLKSECHLCLNCVSACPHGSLQFQFSGERQSPAPTYLDRRKTLAALVAGAVAAPLLRAQRLLQPNRNKQVLRPPGAVNESAFLSRCIRCGECMRVCPNHALQATFTEAGVEGIWTPVLTPRIGYCEPHCVLCSEVCPSGAIQELTVEKKGWVAGSKAGAPVRIGTAVYNKNICLPWARLEECGVCLEWCPVEPKAIVVEPALSAGPDGKTLAMQRPRIDASRCIGCGACEFACPLTEQAGVFICNSGESRASDGA